MSVPRGWHEAWYLGGTQRTSVPSGNERMNQRFHLLLPLPESLVCGKCHFDKEKKVGL